MGRLVALDGVEAFFDSARYTVLSDQKPNCIAPQSMKYEKAHKELRRVAATD